MTVRHRYLDSSTPNIVSRISCDLANPINVPTGVGVAVAFDTITIIDNTCFTYNVGTGQFVFLKTGFYSFWCGMQMTNNVLGARLLNGSFNDGVAKLFVQFGVPSLSNSYGLSGLIRCDAVGATLTFFVVQTSGALLQILAVPNVVANIVRISDL